MKIEEKARSEGSKAAVFTVECGVSEFVAVIFLAFG